MRPANVILAASLLLTAGLWAVAQAPPPDAQNPADHPPPPRDVMDDRPGDHDRRDRDFDRGDDDRDDRDRDDRRRGWRGHDKPMDETEVREAIEILRRIDPGKADRLEQAVNEHPDDIDRVLRDQAPYLGRFMAWRRFDPDGFELRIQDMELSRQARECAERLRDALKAEDDAIAATEHALLKDLVADHFDVRQKIREHELDMLKRRIEQLIEQLEERAEQRPELIDQRVEELIEDKSGDRW